MAQSQRHGFTFENSIRRWVFNLPSESNNTATHDIPKSSNHWNPKENCSIKSSGSNTICCGDILRFYNYDFTDKNTIINVKYTQKTPTEKVVETIYEIDYNRECHKLLFGDLTSEIIEEYVSNVKSIPRNVKGDEAKKIFDYLGAKAMLQQKYPHQININPKVDGSQSRVQCSISNFTKVLEGFITYQSPSETPNLLRGKEIVATICSTPRQRHVKTSVTK